jgi:hypothetical protein
MRAPKSARASKAPARTSKPLRAVDIGKHFVGGGDVKALVRTRDRDADGDADASDDAASDVDVDAIRASYARSDKHVTTAEGFDFARGFEPETATWSLFGGSDARKGEDGARMTTTTTTTTTMREGDETARRGDGARDRDGVTKRDAANEAPARRKKRRKVVRDVREKVSAAAVLGIDESSGIDAIARAWKAPEEKEMLERWHEERDAWREDYKRKRRAALRLRKGVGATILA